MYLRMLRTYVMSRWEWKIVWSDIKRWSPCAKLMPWWRWGPCGLCVEVATLQELASLPRQTTCLSIWLGPRPRVTGNSNVGIPCQERLQPFWDESQWSRRREVENFRRRGEQRRQPLRWGTNAFGCWVVQLEDGGPVSDLPCGTLVTCSGEIIVLARLKECIQFL
jgi:hypothetical protein